MEIAAGWRARRKSTGEIQLQTTTGTGSITLTPEQWTEAFQPLFTGPATVSYTD
jgi:hypothetical protein